MRKFTRCDLSIAEYRASPDYIPLSIAVAVLFATFFLAFVIVPAIV